MSDINELRRANSRAFLQYQNAHTMATDALRTSSPDLERFMAACEACRVRWMDAQRALNRATGKKEENHE